MLNFNKENHVYTWNNKVVPGVSEIMDAVAVKDKDGHYNSISGYKGNYTKESQNFGTEFHKIPVLHIKGKKFTYDKALEPYYNGFKRFWESFNQSGYQYILETPYYSSIYRYAGTPDLLVVDGMRIIIIDWKTCSGVGKHWGIQIKAYQNLLLENFRGYSFKGFCVQIKPDDQITPYKVVEAKTVDNNNWLSILNTYKLMRG
ncbi:MAG: hypothetical protein EHM12_11260 [Dehalococcoidia bacterium]|nr:MAG: hypothetical protein EHM12_11260 [Dehalococcoidia bacterium]